MSTLVSIGYLGFKRVYLNLTVEEAQARYIASEGQLDGDTEVVEFDVEFFAYEVGRAI